MKIRIVYLTFESNKLLDISIKKIIENNIDPADILIIDSSKDNSLKNRFQDSGIEIIFIQNKNFGFAKTKNMAVNLSQDYEYILFISQDCIPKGNYWIENFSVKLKNNAASYCKQITHSSDQKSLTDNYYTDRDRVQKAPIQNIQDGFISNACALYPIKILQDNPFPEWVYTNEDQVWAWIILLQGHSIFYNSKISVINYHNDSIKDTFKKYFDHGVVMGRLYNFIPSTKSEGLRTIHKITNKSIKYPQQSLHDLTKITGFVLGSKSHIKPELFNKFSKYLDLRKKVDLKSMEAKLIELGKKIALI